MTVGKRIFEVGRGKQKKQQQRASLRGAVGVSLPPMLGAKSQEI